MRTTLALFAAGLCLLTTGCRLAVHLARNLAYEPMRYTDDVAECYRNGRLARAAWDHVIDACPDKEFSPDYERGFKDGYVDFMRYRGPGLPPAVPPKCYWSKHYQSAEGHRAIEDYYTGFQHGVQVARAGKRAPFLTVPTHHEGPDPVRANTAPGTPSTAPPTDGAETLPSPKPAREPLPELPGGDRKPAPELEELLPEPGQPETVEAAREPSRPGLVTSPFEELSRVRPPTTMPPPANTVPVARPTEPPSADSILRPPVRIPEPPTRGSPYSVVNPPTPLSNFEPAARGTPYPVVNPRPTTPIP